MRNKYNFLISVILVGVASISNVKANNDFRIACNPAENHSYLRYFRDDPLALSFSPALVNSLSTSNIDDKNIYLDDREWLYIQDGLQKIPYLYHKDIRKKYNAHLLDHLLTHPLFSKGTGAYETLYKKLGETELKLEKFEGIINILDIPKLFFDMSDLSANADISTIVNEFAKNIIKPAVEDYLGVKEGDTVYAVVAAITDTVAMLMEIVLEKFDINASMIQLAIKNNQIPRALVEALSTIKTQLTKKVSVFFALYQALLDVGALTVYTVAALKVYADSKEFAYATVLKGFFIEYVITYDSDLFKMAKHYDKNTDYSNFYKVFKAYFKENYRIKSNKEKKLFDKEEKLFEQATLLANYFKEFGNGINRYDIIPVAKTTGNPYEKEYTLKIEYRVCLGNVRESEGSYISPYFMPQKYEDRENKISFNIESSDHKNNNKIALQDLSVSSVESQQKQVKVHQGKRGTNEQEDERNFLPRKSPVHSIRLPQIFLVTQVNEYIPTEEPLLEGISTTGQIVFVPSYLDDIAISNHHFATRVPNFFNKRILQGDFYGNANLDNNVTVGEFLKLFSLAAGYSEAQYYGLQKHSYTNEPIQFSNYWNYLINKKQLVITSPSNESNEALLYNLESFITRGHVAKIIANHYLANRWQGNSDYWQGPTRGKQFDTCPAKVENASSGWDQCSVILRKNGIAAPNPNFNAGDFLTRGQALAFLDRKFFSK